MKDVPNFIILFLASFGTTATVNAFSPTLPTILAKIPLRPSATDRFGVGPNEEDSSTSTSKQVNGSHEELDDSNDKTTERTHQSLKDRLKSAIEQRELEYQKEEAARKAADYMPLATRLQLAIDRREAESKENSAASSSPFEKSLDSAIPPLSKQGIYQIRSEAEHASLLEANPDKLVVMKFKASYCKACKAIEQSFITVKNDKKLANLPIIWAEFSSTPHTKDFFRRLGVLTLPTIHFYEGYRGLVENFPCAPKNFDVLRQKLSLFIDSRVDPTTLELKGVEGTKGVISDRPRMVRNILIENELVTDEHLDYLRYGMPFFQDLTDEEFDGMLAKARLLTFNEGDIIIRQGMPGKTFFVIKTGVVEMSIRSRFEDPISTPPSYLGAVVNRLTTFDFFGERAATTGEPYAASIRVLEKTRCFAFNVEDIPESSILSKKRRATRAVVEQLSARYALPEDYKPTYPVTERDQCILELLVRFKQIRQAAKCFEYVLSTAPLFGDTGEIARRSMLVSKLSNSQRQDFIEVFNLVDTTHSGTISLLEMRRFMDSAREKKTDAELLEMINKVNRSVDDSKFGIGLTLNEFLGVMAEAEFYSLFTETFKKLDKENTGYVRAGDLDKVLGGVRDLISDDPKSIIDVEDQEVQVDYEQFAKMLLGAAL